MVLLVMVALHIWSSLQLAVVEKRSAPRRLCADANPARLELCVAHHVHERPHHRRLRRLSPDAVHIRRGRNPVRCAFDAYGNVINGFRVPAVSVFYILAMALLCLHLRHGLWSMLQTLGFHHPRLQRRESERAVIADRDLIFLGFVSIPVAVLAGVIPTVL